MDLGLKSINKHKQGSLGLGKWCVVRRSGNDLLSRALRQSTISAKGFNVRVRDGIGWDTFAIITRSSNHTLNIQERQISEI